jgi:hypothetical protein
MAKLDALLDLLKNGMKQSPPAVHGQIPKGFTLDSYREAVQLGLFDNGAPPEEVLEMMRQNGTVGKLEGLQYSDGTSDIDRRRSAINEIVDERNNLDKGSFTDLFPRYQENFQFHGGNPSSFRVKRSPNGQFQSDAGFNYPETGYDDGLNEILGGYDVPRMNMYGNGDFMNTDGLISPNKINGGQPEYIMPNEFPNDDYIVDPSLKIRQAIDSGDLGASENLQGQLSGDPDWYSNKPWNTNEIYLDGLDDWDK